MVCPITSAGNGYPLHHQVRVVGADGDVNGFVEVEQLKALDLEARDAQVVGCLRPQEMDAVTALVLSCVID